MAAASHCTFDQPMPIAPKATTTPTITRTYRAIVEMA